MAYGELNGHVIINDILPKRSRSWPQYVLHPLSGKRLEIQTQLQWSSYNWPDAHLQWQVSGRRYGRAALRAPGGGSAYERFLVVFVSHWRVHWSFVLTPKLHTRLIVVTDYQGGNMRSFIYELRQVTDDVMWPYDFDFLMQNFIVCFHRSG